MKKRLAAVVLVVVVITSALVALYPAQAAGGCGGLWLGGDSCAFTASGTKLWLRGDAFSSEATGPAWVRVEIADPLGNVLLSCEQLGWDYAACDGSIGLATAGLPAGIPLTCNVIGNVRGHWACWTE